MKRRLDALKMAGLMGMEAFYSGFSRRMILRMYRLASRYDLMVTAGSDYHGKNKTVPLGKTGLLMPRGGGRQLISFINACMEHTHGCLCMR